MLVVDIVGNALTANDLVVYSDAKGVTHLCLVGPIMEKQGLLQVFPLPITLTFDPKNPTVQNLIKATKPPGFQKGMS